MKKEVILFFILIIQLAYVSSNNPPVADAREDKTVVIGSTVILDASKSYDEEDSLLNYPLNYTWYEDEKVIGTGVVLKKKFDQGIHTISLKVTDSGELSSMDTIFILVKPKDTCKETNSVYVPQDTVCNKKWPSQDGKILVLNSKGYSCNLVEVCSDELDRLIEDSIDCCDGTPLTYDQSRINACNFANKYSGQNTKKCQALYFVETLGGNSVYMKDYLEAEMCCKGVKELCSNEENLYTARPLPRTGKDLSKLKCNNNPNYNPPGEWVSDSKLELNNIALQDPPTHVSLNILSTGTCVDYSFSLTTLLRKAGYKKDEVYTVETVDHAYNLIKLPLDKKYTLVDTTGNNDPAIIFGKTPIGYKYCENIKNCYNDNGEVLCPDLSEIYGCENVKKSIITKSKQLTFNIGKTIDDINKLIKTELER